MTSQQVNLITNVKGYIVGTKSEIEATTGLGEGSLGYATDTKERGSYDGTTWTWGSGGFPNPFALPADLTPTALTGDVDDYNPTGLSTADILRLDTDGGSTPYNITGLAGGADGRIVILHNISAARNLILVNSSTSSAEANRFLTNGNITIRPGRTAIVFYDATVSRWKLAASGQADSLQGAPIAAGLYSGLQNNDLIKFNLGDNAFERDTPANIVDIALGGVGTSLTELQDLTDGGESTLHTHPSSGIPTDGWIAGTGTWSYTSADDPTFIASVPDADAALIGVGYRLKLTQTTAKYFIVVAKGTPSGGFTPVTIYGGTDYDLANAAITSPFYSPVKAPLGFPMSPAKWSETLTDSTQRSQVTSGTTVYNLGSLSLSCPIGLWRPKLSMLAQISGSASSTKFANFSLSDANNTILAAQAFSLAAGASNVTTVRNPLYTEFPLLSRATKQTYYITGQDANAGANTLFLLNSVANLSLVFECAYI